MSDDLRLRAAAELELRRRRAEQDSAPPTPARAQPVAPPEPALRTPRERIARAGSFIAEAPRDFSRGVASGLSGFGQSWAGLGSAVDPEGRTALGRSSERISEAIEYDPEDLGVFGKVGRVIGRFAPEVATGMGTGVVVRQGLKRAAPRLGAPVIAALSSPNRAVRAGATAIVSSPFDVAQGYQYDEGLLLPGRGGSVAENVASSLLGGALLPAGRSAARQVDAPPASAVDAVTPEVAASASEAVAPTARKSRKPRKPVAAGKSIIPEVPTATPSPRAEELVDEWFNMPRLNLSEDAEIVFRESAARVIEGNPDLLARRSVSFDEMRAAADNIGARMSNADVRRIVERGDLEGPRILVARDLINSTSERMAKLLEKRQDFSLDESAIRVIDNALNELGSINDAVLRSVAREGSERGRSLVMMRILGQNSLEPAVWLQRAKRAVGSRELSSQEQTNVLSLVAAAAKGDDGAMNKLINEIANMEKAGIGQQIGAAWKAFLLSLPRTAAVNVVGNISHTALREADKPVATFADYMLSKMLGTQRTTTWNTDIMGASLRGAKKGMRESFVIMGGKAAREGYRTGGVRGAITEWDKAVRSGNYTSILQKYDINRRVNIEDSKLLDLFTKAVFGLQSASDMPFRTFAYEGALNEMVHVAAMNSGLRRGTPEYANAVKSLYDNPPDDLIFTAIESAMEAVFAHDTRIGSLLSGLKAPLQKLATSENPLTSVVGSSAEFVIPFTRVPSGVATEVVMHSPFGVVRATESLVDLLRARSKGMPAEAAKAQRELASAIAKTTTGTPLMLAGFWMAANKMLSGRRPVSSGERAQQAEEGGQPFAFTIGDRSYSIPKALAPIGGSLALGAVLYEVVNNDDIEGALQQAFAVGTGVAQMAIETTALGGVRDIVTAAADPNVAGRRLESIVSTAAVPQVIAGAARAVDPVVRDPEGIMQSIQSRIPGLSKSLPARLDRFGRPVTRGDSFMERVGQVSDPFYSRPIRTGEDPVLAELGRVGVSSFGPRRAGRDETRDDVRSKVEFEGPILYREIGALMRSPEYARLPDELRRDQIERLITNIRSYSTQYQRSQRGGR